MTDQPAAPFDVAKARKAQEESRQWLRSLGRRVVEKPVGAARGLRAHLDAALTMLLAACDRIEELQHVEGERDAALELADVGSRRAEAAEAHVKALEKEVESERAFAMALRNDRKLVGDDLGEMLKKAEAANAALREVAVQLTRALDRHGDVHSSWSGLTSLDKLVEVLQRPSPGAKLLEELERLREGVRK